ncbi:hypothetical protein, partial [Pseudomonas sp. FW306-02-F08-AA]|uniref:hypothetical protein n=1 Tax=Pseudomonas sp. FW306-02-F08-AA TaxID=2070651 RepID=UPI001C457474
TELAQKASQLKRRMRGLVLLNGQCDRECTIPVLAEYARETFSEPSWACKNVDNGVSWQESDLWESRA